MKKVALIISGNLRTFFMPIRGNNSVRVCDVLMVNVVIPTNADVFLYTDTEDFYLNGKQYFHTKNKNSEENSIDTYNFDMMRMHNKIEFIEPNDSKKLLEHEINSTFGHYLKKSTINKPYDVTTDSKFPIMKPNIDMGSVPEFIIQQHRKINQAYNMMVEYESANEPYDVIIRTRFDVLITPKIDINSYDFDNVDIYTPGQKGPIIYDWSAIGNRNAMNQYCSIYNNLGFTLENQTYMVECNNCGVLETKEMDCLNNQICPICKSHTGVSNITLASERHVHQTVEKFGLRHSTMINSTHVYRYNDSNQPLTSDFLKTLNIGKIKLHSHTVDKGIINHEIETSKQQ